MNQLTIRKTRAAAIHETRTTIATIHYSIQYEIGCCCSIHNLKPDRFNCRSTSETSLSLRTVRENMTTTKKSIPNTTGNNTE